MGRFYGPSRDREFLSAELRWYVLRRRAEIGSYAPSGDRTFILPLNNITVYLISKNDKFFNTWFFSAEYMLNIRE